MFSVSMNCYSSPSSAMLGPRQVGGPTAEDKHGGRPLFNEGNPPEYTSASGEDLRAYRERLHTWRGDYRQFLREQARLRQEGQARLREGNSRRARETAQALAELQVGRPTTVLVRRTALYGPPHLLPSTHVPPHLPPSPHPPPSPPPSLPTSLYFLPPFFPSCPPPSSIPALVPR